MGNLAFAKTLNESGKYGCVNGSDCFCYGSTYGCNCECPVLLTGKCSCEDMEAIAKMIVEDEWLDEEAYSELYVMYPNIKEYIAQFKKIND